MSVFLQFIGLIIVLVVAVPVTVWLLWYSLPPLFTQGQQVCQFVQDYGKLRHWSVPAASRPHSSEIAGDAETLPQMITLKIANIFTKVYQKDEDIPVPLEIAEKLEVIFDWNYIKHSIQYMNDEQKTNLEKTWGWEAKISDDVVEQQKLKHLKQLIPGKVDDIDKINRWQYFTHPLPRTLSIRDQHLERIEVAARFETAFDIGLMLLAREQQPSTVWSKLHGHLVYFKSIAEQLTTEHQQNKAKYSKHPLLNPVIRQKLDVWETKQDVGKVLIRNYV